MPHFDSAGRHADGYDVRSMWVSCRHDPDSKTMVHYDPYTEVWCLYGFYDTDYADPASVIAAAKRMVAAQCRHRYRHGGPPDQDEKLIRDRHAAAIRLFHDVASRDDQETPPVSDTMRRVRLTLEQALNEIRDQDRAAADRLREQIKAGNIFTSPEAETNRRELRQAGRSLSQTMDTLLRTAGLPACSAPGCRHVPIPATDERCPHHTGAPVPRETSEA